MSKSIKNFFIIAAMAAIVLCVGCQKNNSDIDETKAQVSQVSPAVWERSESETRTYNVIAKEHADELRKNESDWLTDGKLDSSKYSTESGEPYRVQMLMPESVAKKLDTKELLDFCLQHSSVKEFTLFNSWEEGFDNVVNVINVFDYIFARDDMAGVGYDAYMAREVVKEDATAQGIDSVLEIILAQDVTYDGLTDEQRKDVIAKKDEFKKCREDNDVRIYGTTSMFGAALESGSKWDSLLK